MKNLKILSLFLIVSVFFSAMAPSASALSDPATYSESIILLEPDSGSVLFSKDENVRAYPASTTKIMTVLLAIEAIEDGRASLTDMVTASTSMNYDLVADGSSAGILVGETMSLQDLLYCAMLSSGNDACNVIAEYIGGTIDNFITMMNDRAQELGCVGTHFANTHGLPDENHYTTAYDLAQITLEAMTHSQFMDICDTVTYEVPATNMSGARTLSNSNGLINENSTMYPGYKYEYAHGIKTGHTNDAGYCLVSTAEKDGVQLVCIVLGGVVINTDVGLQYSNFVDSVALYEWGFNNFSFQDILTPEDSIGTAAVSMGSDGDDSVPLNPQNTVTAFLPNDTQADSLQYDITLYDPDETGALRAPISSGDVLGEVTVSIDGVNYGTVNIVAGSSVGLSKLVFIRTALGDFFGMTWVKIVAAILIVLLVLYIISVVTYRRRRRRYIRYMRAKQAAERREREAAQRSQPQDPVTPQQVSRDYFEEFFKH